MNYRHAYHAGNFADVVKHIILTRIISYFQRKEAGFLYVDTHAGPGRYDLTSPEAQRTGEHTNGIGAFMAALPQAPETVRALIAPYSEVITAFNIEGELNSYPGSPRIAHAMRRRQDRLSLIELQKDDHARLAHEFTGASGVKVHGLDGWQALKAQLPPRERRALVLIDPPYESRDEFQMLLNGIDAALRRFASGVYCAWYPLKHEAAVTAFHDGLRNLDVEICLIEMTYGALRDEHGQPRFAGTGMAIINPPYVLAEEMRAILPWLSTVLGERDGMATWSVRTAE